MMTVQVKQTDKHSRCDKVTYDDFSRQTTSG